MNSPVGELAKLRRLARQTAWTIWISGSESMNSLWSMKNISETALANRSGVN